MVRGAGGAPVRHPVRHLAANEGFLYVPIDLVRPNPDQPRQHFDGASLEDLAASVKEKGVLQPVLVRKEPAGAGFILIAGERRWRAAKAAGLQELPALVRQEEDALEVALIENLQRENLNPIEEAEALLKLKKARNFSDEELAKIIGKSRQAVNDSLTLNELPEKIKAECRTSGTCSKSQLLQVIRAGSPGKVVATWQALTSGELRTVRDLRRHAKAAKGRPRHYRFVHRPKGRPFQVLVSFSKTKATRAEVRAALRDALQHLP
ncbi:MAG: ParB/RepB/Spo0J family partition protein [Candidatus Binataceae bacterium]